MKIALPLTATDEFSSHYGASAKSIGFDVACACCDAAQQADAPFTTDGQ
jgi:hypothetical protein